MFIHPWLNKFPIKNKSKYLIIGTHPPMPYCGQLKFYYGNSGEFWRLLDKVYPNNKLYENGCPQKKDIINFLDKRKISITDIVYKTRIAKFSIDSDMGKVEVEDLNPYLSGWVKKSKIQKIYFTSFGGKNSAKNLFKKWYKNEFGKVCRISSEHVNSLEIHGKKIVLIDLFSPSPSAKRGSSKNQTYINWRKGRKINNSYDDFRFYWYKEKLPKF